MNFLFRLLKISHRTGATFARKTYKMLRWVLWSWVSSASALPITKVYVLWSNHFDLGYTINSNGSCAGAVVNECKPLSLRLQRVSNRCSPQTFTRTSLPRLRQRQLHAIRGATSTSG